MKWRRRQKCEAPWLWETLRNTRPRALHLGDEELHLGDEELHLWEMKSTSPRDEEHPLTVLILTLTPPIL